MTFSTDVFHPLIAPLTTHTHTPSPVDADSSTASEDARLAPGVFSLRHGFPSWFAHSRSNTTGTRNFSGSTDDSAISSSTPVQEEPRDPKISIIQILRYIVSSFSNEELLDSITLNCAANAGAYHAWRTFRGNNGPGGNRSDRTENHAAGRSRRPGEWNWEGVWEARIKKGVSTSLSEAVLYGTSSGEEVSSYSHALPCALLISNVRFAS